jgi:hypothetical protein
MPDTQPQSSADASNEFMQLAQQLCCAYESPSQPSSDDAPEANKASDGDDSDNLRFEYAEHENIGNRIDLKGHGKAPFVLRTNLKLTYGQINGLGGDFFGTDDPICLGKTDEDCEKRFMAAYGTLVDPQNDATTVLKALKAEVESFQKAKRDAEQKLAKFSTEFKASSWQTLQWATLRVFSDTPSMMRLAAVNLDHFGQDARTAYNAGHRCALKHAALASRTTNPTMASNDRQKYLDEAYTMNAFADHFLQDQFASGHLRTPRRKLLDSIGSPDFTWLDPDTIAKNYCAKVRIRLIATPL